MKSPGIIYRRYRQIKKKLLYEKMVAAKQRAHENCHYSKLAVIKDVDGVSRKVKLCLFSLDGTPKVDVCSSPQECNAYVSMWTKEKVIEEFEREINDWTIKNKLYPQLVFFEWILDRDVAEAMKEPGWMGKIIICVIAFLESLLRSIEKNKTKTEEAKEI